MLIFNTFIKHFKFLKMKSLNAVIIDVNGEPQRFNEIKKKIADLKEIKNEQKN